MRKKLLPALIALAVSATAMITSISEASAANIAAGQTATLCTAKNAAAPFKVSCTFKIKDGNTGKTYNAADRPELAFGEHQLICSYKISCKDAKKVPKKLNIKIKYKLDDPRSLKATFYADGDKASGFSQTIKLNIPEETLAKMGDNSFSLYDGKVITKQDASYPDDGIVFVNTGKKNNPKKSGKCVISIRIREDDPSLWEGEK